MMLFGDVFQLRPRARVDVGERARQRLLRVVAFRCAGRGANSLVEDADPQLDAPAAGFAFPARAFDADVTGVDRAAAGREGRDQAGNVALDITLAADVRKSETGMHAASVRAQA